MDELESKFSALNARIDHLERQFHEMISALLDDDESDDESFTLDGADAGKPRQDGVL